MDSSELLNSLTTLESQSDTAQFNPRLWGSIWKDISRIRSSFQSARFPSRSSRDEAWDRLKGVIEKATAARAEHNRQAELAESELVSTLRSLERSLNRTDHNQDWKEFWNEVRTVKSAMIEASFVSRDRKDSLWSHFNGIDARAKQLYANFKEQRESLTKKSEEHKAELLSLLDRAVPDNELINALGAFLSSNIGQVAAVSTFGIAHAEQDERQLELRECSANLTKARSRLTEVKTEMLGSDKRTVLERINEVQTKLSGAWERFNESKKRDREERRIAHQIRQEEKERKRQEYKDRLSEHLSRLRDRLSDQEDYRRSKESKLEKLWDDYHASRSGSYADRLRGWIDCEQDRLRAIEERIENIRTSIDEVESKLST